MKKFITDSWGSKPDVFPAPQPVSIERQHIPVLHNNKYLVTDKTDGVRHLLVCFGSEIMMVNRKFEMIPVDFSLPNWVSRGVVIDGELMTDGSYIIYDVVMMCGKIVANLKLPRRLLAAAEFVRRVGNPQLRIKKFYTMHRFDDFYNNILPHVGYQTDGLIFVPVDEPVATGTQNTMFKWKPQSKNTIDFLVSLRSDGSYGMYIQERGNLIFQQILNHPEYAVDNTIVECRRNGLNWEPIMVRTDKSYPNSRFTYYKTLKNIRENIEPHEFTCDENKNMQQPPSI